MCSAQSRNLCNLKIALRILRIPKLRTNLEIAHWVYAISRLRGTIAQSRDRTAPVRNLEIARHQCAILRSHGTGAQSQDSITSVACTIGPFGFPSYIKVRDIHNKLLQLRRHLQCQACILKPSHQGLLGSLPTWRNSLPLSLGTGTERSQTYGGALFKTSPSLKVLNSLLLVSLDALTLLAHYKLHSRNLKIVQFRDCTNVLRSLKIGCAISRLARNFGILRMRSVISRLRKFLDCVEHMHILVKYVWFCTCFYNILIIIHSICLGDSPGVTGPQATREFPDWLIVCLTNGLMSTN